MKLHTRFAAVAALALTILPTPAATLVWTNPVGGNWATAANWSPNQVPGAGDDAFITNAGAYTVTITGVSAVSNLVVGLDAPGGQPKLSLQSTLTVNGSWRIGTNGAADFIGTLDGAGSVTNRGLVNLYASLIQGAGLFVNEPQGVIVEPFSFGLRYLYRKLINRGVFDAGNRNTPVWQMSTLGAVTNEPGGVLTLGVSGFGGSAPAAVVNRGTLNLVSPNQTFPSSIEPPFFNHGTVNVGVSNSLTIFYAYLYSGGTNTGVINISPNGWLFNLAGTLALESGTQLLGTGLLISQNTGDILFNTPLATSNQIYCGWTLASPAMRINANLTSLNTFTIATGGRLFLTNPAVILDCRNLFVGTASAFVTNGATIQADVLQVDNGTIQNAATINVRSNFNFNGGSFYGFGTATFNTLAGSTNIIGSAVGKNLYTTRWHNHGTVDFNTASALWFLGSHWVNHPGGVVNASGTALINNYTVGYTNSFVNHGLVQRSGIGSNPSFDLPTTNYGSVKLLGTILTLGQFTQLGGATDLSGSTINSARFNILGGELLGAATVQTSPSLYNAADLRPGSPLGLLSVAGPFTNAGGGTYHLQMGGNLPAQYDRIGVGGTATLAGTLAISFTNGFYPTIGNTFTALTYTARSGVFDAIVCDTYEFEALYTPTNLLLLATNALPVVNLTLPPGGSHFVCQPFPLAVTASDLDGVITNLTLTFDGSTLATTNGTNLAVIVEKDFPSANLVTATAIDDRGGVRTVSQNLMLVTAPPEVLMLGGIRSNTTFKVCMAGLPGTNYAILATTNLLTTNWVNLGLMEATNGIWRYFDTGVITNPPRRFYRAVRVP